jgi:hypothetical protein
MNKLKIKKLSTKLSSLANDGFKFNELTTQDSNEIICAFLGIDKNIDASSVIKHLQIKSDDVGKLTEVQRRLVSQSWIGEIISWNVGDGFDIKLMSEPLPSGKRSWNIVLTAKNNEVQYDVILGAVSKEGHNTQFRLMNVVTKTELATPPEADPNQVIIHKGETIKVNALENDTELIRYKEDGSFDPVFGVFKSFDFKMPDGDYVATTDITRGMLGKINCPAALHRVLEIVPVKPKVDESIPEEQPSIEGKTVTVGIDTADGESTTVEVTMPPSEETGDSPESSEEHLAAEEPSTESLESEATPDNPEVTDPLPSPDEILPDGFGEESGGEFPEDDEPEKEDFEEEEIEDDEELAAEEPSGEPVAESTTQPEAPAESNEPISETTEKETQMKEDIEQTVDPEPVGEIPAQETTRIEEPPKPFIGTIMSKDDFLRKLFGTHRPTILHVRSKLEQYGKTSEIYKCTGSFPAIQDIVYPDYTYSIVRMKNGAYYRIFVAYTNMEDLQGSCWEATREVEGRWLNIADVSDPKISAIENQRRMCY